MFLNILSVYQSKIHRCIFFLTDSDHLFFHRKITKSIQTPGIFAMIFHTSIFFGVCLHVNHDVTGMR